MKTYTITISLYKASGKYIGNLSKTKKATYYDAADARVDHIKEDGTLGPCTIKVECNTSDGGYTLDQRMYTK